MICLVLLAITSTIAEQLVAKNGRPSDPGSSCNRPLTRNMQGLRDVKSAGNSLASKEAISRNSTIPEDQEKLKS